MVKPKEIKGVSGDFHRVAPNNSSSQPRPPRYNHKTSRSASLPSGYPSGAGVGKGTGDSGGSGVSLRSHGSSSKEMMYTQGGQGWGGGAIGNYSVAKSGSTSRHKNDRVI